MSYIKLLFLILFSTVLYSDSLEIDDKTDFYDLLSHSQVYIDKTKSLEINDIVKKDKELIVNNKKLLGYGYSPDFNVWVKFTLKNKTDKNIEKIIEYDNSMTTQVVFYDLKNNQSYIDGLFHINKDRKTINSTFKISLNPNETKTYYLKASSHVTTLIIKLNLWNSDKFYEKEIKHQFILALFFGAMFILAIYNLFIYFFTKDISYLYYVLYIFGIIAHHLMYVGIANIYLLNSSFIVYIVEFASVLVAFPIFALGLFTKTFLQTKQYKILNTILTVLLFAIVISSIVFITTDDFNKYRNIPSMILIVYLIFITIYVAFKKNRQAYFILFGWLIISIAGILMYLSSAGIFNIYLYSNYIIEFSLISEAIIFSIALADRIKQLQTDKEIASKKLFTQQQNEKERLEVQVNEKTKDLTIALNEKGLLLKELNHRVKNNMQTIVSLLRLQGDEIDDDRLQDIFLTVQNRINAMSHLHELLYSQDNISHINAFEYFDILISELQDSYDSNIVINYDIKTDLKMEQAIYCGLILNELVTNSFKYAFENGEGNIDISLYKDGSKYILSISDNGKGYDKDIPSNSLGLILVNTLAREQLSGDIKIDSENGVKVNINWSDNE